MKNIFAGSLFDLGGTVSIVTGSTKGMGRSIVQRFVQHGSRVVVSSRNQADCDSYAGELNAAAGGEVAIGIAADLLDVASLISLVNKTVKRFGRLDNLVCNAAVLSFGREDEMSPEAFSGCLTGNIRNNYLLSQHALPHLRQSGRGSIIMVSSAAAYRGDEMMGVYAIAKRGLIQLTENMALYLGRDNIRVNCIVPGFIRTEASRPLWTDPTALQAGKNSSPLGRIGEGDDIAGAAIFLSAESGNFTTGSCVHVDGGTLITGAIGGAVNARERLPGYLQTHLPREKG